MITLAQLAKIEKDPLRSYIITNMLREIKIMEMLPFENVNSLKSVAVRWRTLPSVAFRAINAGYTGNEGDFEQVWEAVYGFGGEINYDRVFEKLTNTIVDMKRAQTDMKILAMALQFNDYFINGDPAVDPLGFTGLRVRVAGMPARQTVRFAGAAAAALDPTAAVANGRFFIDALEQMHYVTNRGDHNAFVANEGIKWGVGRVLRYIQASGGNILSVTKDSFDRDIPTLWGSPIVDIGLQKDQTTEIITNTEVAGDAALDATSVYCMAFNNQQGVIGIQLSDMEVYDPLNGGEQEALPAKMVRIDWWTGLATFGSYGIARGVNVEGANGWT